MPPWVQDERVVAGLRPGFRACFKQGLRSDPTMEGRFVVTAKIFPSGEVASADVVENKGLSAGVVQCALRKVRRASFRAPGPDGVTIEIPVTFVQQGK